MRYCCPYVINHTSHSLINLFVYLFIYLHVYFYSFDYQYIYLYLFIYLFIYLYIYMPIQTAERPKASVYGRSLPGIAGSNPAGGMHVCLL